MKYNPEIHHRRSIRLKGYDYTQPGAYFVTFCSYQRDEIFGEVINGEMKLPPLGEIVRQEWFRSGEIRKVHVNCRATIGEVGNEEHNLRSIGKAGAQRWRGIRPTVRGVVMNPIDHPHGGGEGRTAAGRHPVSPWGTPAKGFRTRTNKRTDNMIVRRRYSNKG